MVLGLSYCYFMEPYILSKNIITLKTLWYLFVRNFDITCPGVALIDTWQCYPLLAVLVRDSPEQFIDVPVIYSFYPICQIATDAVRLYSAVWLLINSSDQHVYSELLKVSNIATLHDLGVYPIHNQFKQQIFCNVNQFCQYDELHQALLRLV